METTKTKKKIEEKEEKKVKVRKTQREYNFKYRKKLNKNRETVIVKRVPDGTRGRPKGTVKQYKFEETKLGFFLKYLCPIEYKLIMRSTPKGGRVIKPSVSLIEGVAIASNNSFLRSHKYFLYLNEYKEQGLWVKTPKKMTPQRLKYYNKLLKKQEELYLKEVRESGQTLL